MNESDRIALTDAVVHVRTLGPRLSEALNLNRMSEALELADELAGHLEQLRELLELEIRDAGGRAA